MKNQGHSWKRRTFLSGLASTPLIGPVAGRANQATGSVVQVGVVGLGSAGRACLRTLKELPMFRVVAVCDVDKAQGAAAARIIAEARFFEDFQEMLEDKEIDAVVVATPSHWSAFVTAFAMQRGKDVYVETPIARTIDETQTVARMSARQGRVLFSGSPMRSRPLLEDLAEKIADLGRLHFINAAVRPPKVVLGKAAEGPAPVTVDYEKWLGPVPSMPFNLNHFHDRWPYFWEFGGGIMTQRMLRLLDVVAHTTPLGFENQIRLSSRGDTCWPSAVETPDTMATTFEFGNGLTLAAEFQAWHVGSQGYRISWHGEDGKIVLDDQGLTLARADGKVERKEAPSAPGFLYGMEDVGAHFKAFHQAMMERRDDLALKARNGTLLAHVGNVAYRTREGKEELEALQFDPTAAVFQSPAANVLVSTPYREGFSLKL